jgi:signal transduction histidine kinase
MRPKRGSSSVAALLIAVSIGAICFLVATVHYHLAAQRIQREARVLLSNAAPATQRLTDARTALRHLDGELDDAMLDLRDGKPFDRQPPREARREIERALDAYERLPSYHLEREYAASVRLALGRVDGVLDRLTAAIADRDLPHAHRLEDGEWRSASDQLDDAISRLVLFNVERSAEHARGVESIWRSSSRAGLAFGGLTILLSAVATLLAARTIRRQIGRERERSTELEAFAGRVAHDLTSPLNAVALALELERQDRDQARVVRRRGVALSSLMRVRGLVDGLLDFARAGARPDPSVRTAVDHLLPPLLDELRAGAEPIGVTLSCRLPSPCEVDCAPGVLTSLITNLVRNAVKYMGDREVRQVTVRVLGGAGTVRVEVDDTGPGLSPELAARAFDPYVRGSSTGGTPGIGLGLATVKRLVEGHGGEVGVSSPPGGGARFWFELPGRTL